MSTLNSNELIVVDGLDIKYGKRVLFTDAKITINKGERVFISGENGSGKSSLLKYMTGVIKSKNVTIKKGLKFALTPQSVDFKNTIGDLITRFAFMLGTQDIIPRIKESFGLKHLFDKKFDEISSGEKQRVKLALSFLRKPDLIVLDEFSKGLDPGITHDFIQLIKNLTTKFDISLLIISHNGLVLDSLATREFRIENEKIKEVQRVKK